MRPYIRCRAIEALLHYCLHGALGLGGCLRAVGRNTLAELAFWLDPQEPAMKRIVLILASALAAASVAACGQTIEQKAATGAVAGALVAGPVGAAVGGAAGAAVGQAEKPN